ncbi:TPA: AAA family ATPase [Photobacterium damselae]
MKLKTLTLENFRGFKHFKCDFQPGINVLVGLNGYGKTSLLDAIMLAYAQFIGGFGTASNKNISDADIHKTKHLLGETEDDGFNMEYQLPTSITIETYSNDWHDFPESWARVRNTLKGGTSNPSEPRNYAHNLQSLVRNNDPVILPLFSYYGTARLWPSDKMNLNFSKLGPSRLDVYTDCLDPASKYEKFSSWLKKETIADHERKMRIIEESGLEGAIVKGSTVRGRLLEAVRQAINTCLASSGWSNIRYSANAEEVVATHKEQGEIPVSHLSDGVRNMIGMVADIAYRAVNLNPKLDTKAVVDTHGIVLIDEVDMHLHPQWQQLVLKNLAEAFPNIQFIVTTHSPLVIGDMKPSQVLLIKKEGSNKYFTEHPAQTYGLTSNDILNEVMRDRATSSQISRNKEVEEFLEDIHDLISKKQYEDASNKIEELEELLEGEIPELVSAKLSIDLAGWDE